MSNIHRTALVNFSQEQMFDLIYDVKKYPDFLPWCAGARFIEEKPTAVIAEVDIDYKSIRQSFSTNNHIKRYEQIAMTLIDGPFKHLNGNWQLNKLSDNACKIIFDLDFEFKGIIMHKLMGPVFSQISNNMVDSFITHAKKVYV